MDPANPVGHGCDWSPPGRQLLGVSLLRAVFLLPFLLFVISCYTYVPTRFQDVAVGANVRATLSTESATALETSIGVRGGQIAGQVVEHTNSRLLLLVRAQGTGVQLGSAPLYQRVDVAAPDILRVDARVLSKVRTGGLVAALLGVATVMLVQAFGEGGPGSTPNGPNPVE